MTTGRPARWALISAFLALVCAGCVQDAAARLSIFWRGSVVSWDSPTTQLHDELAIQGIVYLDAARQLRERVGAALLRSGRLDVPPDPVGGDTGSLTSRLTRSPPVA
ncbi:MAG TPA: hypothetical protein VFV05_23575 [Methylomirabilota bacterium]|nr:hypothetical protein [Methylomirabilota bacterium]